MQDYVNFMFSTSCKKYNILIAIYGKTEIS